MKAYSSTTRNSPFIEEAKVSVNNSPFAPVKGHEIALLFNKIAESLPQEQGDMRSYCQNMQKMVSAHPYRLSPAEEKEITKCVEQLQTLNILDEPTIGPLLKDVNEKLNIFLVR